MKVGRAYSSTMGLTTSAERLECIAGGRGFVQGRSIVLRKEGTAFALQTATPWLGSVVHVKWRSRLQ